jgi:hypothetical protein
MVSCSRKNGGLHKEALGAVALSSSHQICTLLLSEVSIAKDLVHLSLADLGPMLSILSEWVANLSLAGSLN